MSLSPWQIAVIVILLILLFGPKRLPGLGKAIGEALRSFKKGLDGKESKEELTAQHKQSSPSNTDADSKKEEKNHT